MAVEIETALTDRLDPVTGEGQMALLTDLRPCELVSGAS